MLVVLGLFTRMNSLLITNCPQCNIIGCGKCLDYKKCSECEDSYCNNCSPDDDDSMYWQIRQIDPQMSRKMKDHVQEHVRRVMIAGMPAATIVCGTKIVLVILQMDVRKDWLMMNFKIIMYTCEEAIARKTQINLSLGRETRRRMNITSSISRPGDQQCAIVDVVKLGRAPLWIGCCMIDEEGNEDDMLWRVESHL